MANDRRIDWSYFLDVRNFVKGNRDAQGSLTNTQKAMGGLKKVMGAVAVAFGAREVLGWAADAINLATAAEEVESKFQAVFGASEQLRQSLEEWGDVAGVTETKGMDLAATLGNLAMAQGISREATEELTLDVAQLAGDLASFNDQDPAQVFQNLTKAITTTERESLKPLGIAITEAEVKQRALARAIADGRTEATKADRAFASYEIAVEQAGKANGDLARTADSAANRERRLRASLQETQEAIGKELLPVWLELLEAAENLTPVLEDTAGAVGGMVAPISRLGREFKDLNDEGSFVEKSVSNVGEALNLLISPARWVKDAVAGAGDAAEDAAIQIRELERSGKGLDYSLNGIPALAGSVDDALSDVAASAKDAADEMATAMEDAQRRVGDAVGDWVRILDDLAGAYNRTATRVAANDFLAGGRGNVDYDRGEDFTRSQTVYRRANGLD